MSIVQTSTSKYRAIDDRRERPNQKVKRRQFLGLAAGVATAGHGAASAKQAYGTVGSTNGYDDAAILAFITDAHIQTDLPDNDTSLRLKATIKALQKENVLAILDAGDVVDFGRSDEYEDYLNIVEPIRSQLHNVPGNHTAHFHWRGFETWEHYFGPRYSSFTADGIHIVMFNTAVINQGSAYATREALEWLRDDLIRSGRERPTIIVTHHPPLGDGFYFMQNQDDFFETIKPFNIRGILCGHTHAEQIRKVNGITVLVGKAHKINTGYYRLKRSLSEGHDSLEVTYVALPDPVDERTAPGETFVTTISLDIDSGPGDPVEPANLYARITDDVIRIHARYGSSAPIRDVAAALYDPYMSRGQWPQEEWTPLSLRGRSATGEIPLMAPIHSGDPEPSSPRLPPGAYRVMIRSSDPAGNQWRSIVPVTNPGPSFGELWEHSLEGSIHASLAESDGLIVAASTQGEIVAFRTDGVSKSVQWRTRTGPVYNDLTFSADGKYVLVPSLDQHLYALNAQNGRLEWRLYLHAPVSSDPLATMIDGKSRVIQTAGRRTYCIDSIDASIIWQVDIGLSPDGKPGSSAGRPDCDGERVYFGCGTGYARAVDAGNGDEIWNRLLTPHDGRSPTHAPWVSDAVLIPDDLLMLGTTTCAGIMCRDDGTDASPPLQDGNFVWCPPKVVSGYVLVPSTDGIIRRVNPASGNVEWRKYAARDALNARIVADGNVAYTTSTSGIVNRVDIEGDSNTEVEVLRRLSNARIIATPVLTNSGSVFVAGDQDGVVRGFAI